MKKRLCRFCDGPKHADFASMCEASYDSLLAAFAALSEEQNARLRGAELPEPEVQHAGR